MKKFYRIVCLLCFSVLMMGCTGNKEEPENQDRINIKYSTSDEYVDAGESTEIDKIVLTDETEIIIYDCVFYRKEQGDLINVDIHYPQIRFSKEVEYLPIEIQQINQQIYDYIIQEDDLSWHNRRYNCSVSYTVSYIGEDYFSIIFEGEQHAKTPSVLNFNMKTGEQVSLKEIISEEKLWSIIKEKPETITESESIKSVGGREGVIEYLEGYFETENHLNDYAIMKDGVKIIIFNKMDYKIYSIVNIEVEK